MINPQQIDLLTGTINEEAIDYDVNIIVDESPCIGLMNACPHANAICQYNKSACQTLEINL